MTVAMRGEILIRIEGLANRLLNGGTHRQSSMHAVRAAAMATPSGRPAVPLLRTASTTR